MAPLPHLAIAPTTISVSGVSSGGYLAGQFHLAYSSLVDGVGVFAAGPWGCARGSLSRALGDCLSRPDSAPDPAALVAQARAAAARGNLDPIVGLGRARVWIFHGTRDDTVAVAVSTALVEFYRAFVPAAQLRYVDRIAAPHGIPTLTTGSDCGSTQAPYLYACGYDGVGEMLAFLDGGRAAVAAAGSGVLARFDQTRYDPSGSLAAIGFVYVPAACAGAHPCRLHVAFHGCRQGSDFVGERFARESGYDRYADRHELVVLFPQARRSLFLPLNPEGCWDWWGYSSADYLGRDAPELAAVRAMVRAVAGF
ncbi:MAG: polyhydroxybutyrate depolymerase [Proteobacteria bacterium]|nr:polyhydroxybutyrate depolymerase [Pseudomonadota bacterium]